MNVYHGHVYFDLAQLPLAEQVRTSLATALPQLTYNGQPITRPIGPHTKPMFEIHFYAQDLSTVLNKLETLRMGLSVLLHPVQRDELAAHTSKAQWLGQKLELKLEVLTSGD